MATKLHHWLEESKRLHSSSDAPSAKGQAKRSEPKKQKSSGSQPDGVRKAVIAVGDYVQEIGRWVGVFQGGFFTVAVFKKRPGFEKSMSVTNEFAQNDDSHQLAWASLMEDLVGLTVPNDSKSHIDVCKQFLDLEPTTWLTQVHFCRVALTHDKERIKIKF